MNEIPIDFSRLNYDEMAQFLQGRAIIDPGSDRMIIVTAVKPYSRKDVGGKYKSKKYPSMHIENVEPGSYWSVHRSERKMQQFLVTATDNGVIGACVRVQRASCYDPEKQTFVAMPREGDISRYFSLQPFEKGRLRLRVGSNALFLERYNN